VTFIHTDEVQIVWRSDTALSASVRDAHGIVDVRFTVDGWSCTCGEDYGCSHVLALKSIAAAAS
jgi:hypothetical protein